METKVNSPGPTEGFYSIENKGAFLGKTGKFYLDFEK